MTSPSAQATTPVQWVIQPAPVRALSIPLARLLVPLYLGSSPPGYSPVKEACWLDTGAPLSVVPFHVHNQRLAWHRIPGIQTTWSGQACDLGRIDFWLEIDQPPYLRGPLSFLAKFAQSDPPGPPVPVLLGLEFFLTHQAELTLPLPPQHGVIQLPWVETPRRPELFRDGAASARGRPRTGRFVIASGSTPDTSRQ